MGHGLFPTTAMVIITVPVWDQMLGLDNVPLEKDSVILHSSVMPCATEFGF